MNKKIRNDIILALALIAVSVIAFFVFAAAMKDGSYVCVIVDGEQVARYGLGDDRRERIETENGTNLVVIEGGKARIEEADCPDGICEQHRPVSKSGQTIVCLPHRLVIEVE